MRKWLNKYREQQVAPATSASFIQLRKVWAAGQTFWGLCVKLLILRLVPWLDSRGSKSNYSLVHAGKGTYFDKGCLISTFLWVAQGPLKVRLAPCASWTPCHIITKCPEVIRSCLRLAQEFQRMIWVHIMFLASIFPFLCDMSLLCLCLNLHVQ